MSEWNQEKETNEQPITRQNEPGQPGFQEKTAGQPVYSTPPNTTAGEKLYTDSADTSRRKTSGPPPYSIQAPEGYRPPYQPAQPYTSPSHPQPPVADGSRAYGQAPGQTYAPQNPPYTSSQPHQGQPQQPAYGYVYQKPARPGKGMGTAAMVLGILALVFVISIWFPIILGIIAISLGAASWVKGRCGTGLAGVIMGIVAIVLVILIVALGFSILGSISNSGWDSSYNYEYYDYVDDSGLQPVNMLYFEGDNGLASSVTIP